MPFEPLAPQLAPRENKKYKCAIDLAYAYALTPLDEETFKLTSFSSCDKLPVFFPKQMSNFIETLIEQGLALVFIDEILLFSNSKEHMFQQLHANSTKNNLKLAPEKKIFMLPKLKILGHGIGYNTIRPIHSNFAVNHNIPSPTGKVVLMSFIDALNFYTNVFEKLHTNLKPFYEMLPENTPGNRTDEQERLFSHLKRSLSSATELTIPSTIHQFLTAVDASLIGFRRCRFPTQ